MICCTKWNEQCLINGFKNIIWKIKNDDMKYLHGKTEGNFWMTKQKRNLMWKNKEKISISINNNKLNESIDKRFCSHDCESWQNVTNERNVNMKKIYQFCESLKWIFMKWANELSNESTYCCDDVDEVILIEMTMYQRYSTLNLNKMNFMKMDEWSIKWKLLGDMITFDMKLKCERLMYWRYAMVKIDWINFSESDVKSAQLRKNKL